MKRQIAVDIDETLCDTRVYWFSELSRHFGAPGGLGVAELIAEYQYTSNVPTWQSSDAVGWLKKNRFDPELHRGELPVVPGAVEGMLAVSERFDIVYLTMRPEAILEASSEWLRNNGFPHGEIQASPNDLDDALRPAWKGAELMTRFPQIVGLIDDSAEVAMAVPTDYRGKIFLLGRDSIDRNDIHIECCPDWTRVVSAIDRALPRALTP